MSNNVFTYTMPAGIPGVVSRVGGRMPDIETQVMESASPVLAYGLAGMIDATTGQFRQLTSGDTAIYGFLVRPYPTQATTASGFSGQLTLGTAQAPPTTGAIDVLKSGYMTVLLTQATAAKKNGTVYVRIADNDATGLALGSVSAAADSSGGTNTLSLGATAYFMGPADANNNVEIGYNI